MSPLRKLYSELSYLTGRYLVKPDYLCLITTFRCNLRCPACDIWQKKDFSDELSIKEWLQIIDELKDNFSRDTYIEINGGEALLNQDLVLSIISRLKEFFFYLVLNSNGTFIDEQIIKQLEKAGLDSLKISFYSLDKNIHNQMRGTGFAYDSVKETIDLILKSKIKLEVAVLITKQNISLLPELIKWLNQKKIGIILQSLDEKIESKESKLDDNYLPRNLWPDKNDVKEFFSWLRPRINQLRIKNPLFFINQIENYYLNPESVLNYRCFVGQRNFVIYPNGEVAFCFKSKKIGNLRKNSVKEILKGKQAFLRRKEIKSCKKLCRIIGCNFSRGIKEYFNL